MKRTLLFIVSILSFAALSAQEQKEVVTGPGYMNDIYYSLENGNVDTASRTNWDLGFTTSNYSISILANTVDSVELYTWNLGDNSDWETLDTTGMEWKPMYNSLDTTWDGGAFTINALGHPDYGWGVFTMGGDYPTVGDSLFVIKTINGNYKKLDIISYAAMTRIWQFRFANLDGTDEVDVTFNAGDYGTKNFIYYSLDSAELVDREPASVDWDLVFTKYTTLIQMGPTPVPWPVTGVLANDDHIEVQEVRADTVDQATYVEYVDSSFVDYIAEIGYDWKSFNFDTYSYDMDTKVVYFLKRMSGEGDEQDSTYYKIYFTDFSGSSEGIYTFMQERFRGVSVRDREALPLFEVYPNPASDYVNLVFDYFGEVSLQIIDMTGRTVYRSTHHAGGLTDLPLDIERLDPGLFFLKLDTGESSNVLRFIKQ